MSIFPKSWSHLSFSSSHIPHPNISKVLWFYFWNEVRISPLYRSGINPKITVSHLLYSNSSHCICFNISSTIVYFYTTHIACFFKKHTPDHPLPQLKPSSVGPFYREKIPKSLLKPTKTFMTCLLTVLQLHHSMQFHKHAKQAPPLAWIVLSSDTALSHSST